MPIHFTFRVRIAGFGFVIHWGLRQSQRELTPDISSQLADWNNLLQLNTGVYVKAQLSPQYLCWAHLYDDDPQLWLLAPKGPRIYPLDIAPAYIKYQFNSGMKELPKAGEVTDVIRGSKHKDTFHLISQDNWMKTVKINRNEGGRIADFQLWANLIYILREGGVLFVAELSAAEGLEGSRSARKPRPAIPVPLLGWELPLHIGFEVPTRSPKQVTKILPQTDGGTECEYPFSVSQEGIRVHLDIQRFLRSSIRQQMRIQ